MAGKYTYLLADLRTNAILAELPLKNLSATRQLNGAGSFSANLFLDDPKIPDLDPIGSTQPARTALYVDRDGVLIWGGIIWTRNYSNNVIGIAGSEFWSYFRARRIVDTKTYTTQDQLFIARDLINYAQGKPGGDIGIVVGSQTSGVTRDRTYYGYEFKPIAEAVEQLSQVINGFDFIIDVGYSSGVATKTLVLSYPRRGATVASTGHLFELPGNILSYSWPEDGASIANTSYAIGIGEGDAMLRSVAARPDLIDVGYPLMEDAESYKDVSRQATLDAHALADVAAKAYPVTVPSITVRADSDPVLGSYTLGDDIRIRINDARFPDTMDTYKRIIGIGINPPDEQGESVTLNLGDV